MGIFEEKIDHIPEIHVDGGTQGNDHAEADVGAHAPVEQRPAEASHVGDEGDVSLFRVLPEEGGVEVHGGRMIPRQLGPTILMP